MSELVQLEEIYDPVIKRWRIICPLCGRESVRAKREAGEHVMTQHVAYDHEREVAPRLRRVTR